MALFKDGVLYGSLSTYKLSAKLQYHEVRNHDQLYSLHLNKKGEWMIQIFKFWTDRRTGKEVMSLQDTMYDVSNLKSDPFVPKEIKPIVPDLVYPDADDDVPF